MKNPRCCRPKIPLDARELAQPRITSAEFLKNTKAEPLFCHWLDNTLRKEDRILYEEAINAGAMIAGCSPVTAKRYLDKQTSMAGPYQVIYDDMADAKFVEFKRGPINLGPNLLNDSKGPDTET